MYEYIGKHIIADFWESNNIGISEMIEILTQAALITKSKILNISSYEFDTQGFTIILLLAESHISIHTWPEKNYIGIDVFTCGSRTEPLSGIEYIKKKLEPKKYEIQKIVRGKY